jgi:hypothetical protein
MPDNFDIQDFPESHYLRICGINYAYELFEAFGKDGFPVDAILRIEKREDDVITVSRLFDLEECLKKLAGFNESVNTAYGMASTGVTEWKDT